MAVIERKGRAQVFTASGWAVQRQAQLVAFSIRPAGNDLAVEFKNGSGGQVLWTAEADAASGSHAERFDPPISFPDGIYLEFSIANDNQAVCVEIL